MNSPRGRRRLLLALPAVAYAFAIVLLSSQPGLDLPATGVPSGDKALHIVEYAVLGILLLLPIRDLGWRARAVALGVGSAYAAFDEAYQTTVPGRFGDVWDIAMDVVGLTLAVGVHVVAYRTEVAKRR